MFAVVGTFGYFGGKSSYIGGKIIEALGCEGINGGHLDDLKDIDFTKHNVLLWMPNINNTETKILPRIKAKNRKLLLISSKRCIENDYTESDVIGHLLKNHSNLGIMIEQDDRHAYIFKLLDPLGNIYCDTREISKLCIAIIERVKFLLELTRVPSWQIPNNKASLPDVSDEFINIVHSYGDQFAQFVNAVNPNRFLGNAATRCGFGFPAQRNGNSIHVTRRNVDKTSLAKEDFVKVVANRHDQGGWWHAFPGNLPKPFDSVMYWGEHKPSVDTPIQLQLFDYYPHVNFIIHGHVYVKGAQTTKRKIPCGALEEFDDIIELFPLISQTSFCINLQGHGCLILAADVEYFKLMESRLIARPFPEGI